MTEYSEETLRELILEALDSRLRAVGMNRTSIDFNQDLLKSGVVDSFSLIDLILAIEDRIGVKIDFFNVESAVFSSVNGLVRLMSGSQAALARDSEPD